jgi:hypothetical protein
LATAKEGREAAKFGLETQRTTMEAPQGAPGTEITLKTPEGESVTSLRVPVDKPVDKLAENRIKQSELNIKKTEQELKNLQKKGGLRDFDDVNSFRKDYMSNDVTKETNKVRSAFTRIQASAKNPSPAGDLSIIFNYMKMLDPGSTVREGEFATAQNSGSIPDIIAARYNKVISGERLSQDQRLDFLDRSYGLWEAQVRSQEVTDKQFRDFAEQYGVDTKNIIPQDYNMNQNNNTNISFAPGVKFPSIIPTAQAQNQFNPNEYIGGK